MREIFSRIIVLLLVAIVIFGAWYTFLSIVNGPPIDTSPALIMIWASVFILLLALFPNILDKIKKIKIKDFELELQDTVAMAISQDVISIADLDDHIFSTKSDFENLCDILATSFSFPNKPVLFVVNVKDNDYISILMLFIYLTFLDMIGSSITVLFVSARKHIKSFEDISKDAILGAISGKKVIRGLLRRFPRLFRIYNYRNHDDSLNIEQFFRSGNFKARYFEQLFRSTNEIIGGINEDRSVYLTRDDIRN